jgi:hypothetical protein
LSGKQWAIFAESDYEAFIIKPSSNPFIGYSTIVGVRHYFGQE